MFIPSPWAGNSAFLNQFRGIAEFYGARRLPFPRRSHCVGIQLSDGARAQVFKGPQLGAGRSEAELDLASQLNNRHRKALDAGLLEKSGVRPRGQRLMPFASVLSERSKTILVPKSSALRAKKPTERSVMLMAFLGLLGYNVFDPSEVVQEHHADFNDKYQNRLSIMRCSAMVSLHVSPSASQRGWQSAFAENGHVKIVFQRLSHRKAGHRCETQRQRLRVLLCR